MVLKSQFCIRQRGNLRWTNILTGQHINGSISCHENLTGSETLWGNLIHASQRQNEIQQNIDH